MDEQETELPDPQLNRDQHRRRSWRQAPPAGPRAAPCPACGNSNAYFEEAQVHHAQHAEHSLQGVKAQGLGSTEMASPIPPSTPKRPPQRRRPPTSHCVPSGGPGDPLSVSGLPLPGTVEDQSSCALLLLPPQQLPSPASADAGARSPPAQQQRRPSKSVNGREGRAAETAPEVAPAGPGLCSSGARVAAPQRMVLVPVWVEQPWMPPAGPQAWHGAERGGKASRPDRQSSAHSDAVHVGGKVGAGGASFPAASWESDGDEWPVQGLLVRVDNPTDVATALGEDGKDGQDHDRSLRQVLRPWPRQPPLQKRQRQGPLGSVDAPGRGVEPGPGPGRHVGPTSPTIGSAPAAASLPAADVEPVRNAAANGVVSLDKGDEVDSEQEEDEPLDARGRTRAVAGVLSDGGGHRADAGASSAFAAAGPGSRSAAPPDGAGSVATRLPSPLAAPRNALPLQRGRAAADSVPVLLPSPTAAAVAAAAAGHSTVIRTRASSQASSSGASSSTAHAGSDGGGSGSDAGAGTDAVASADAAARQLTWAIGRCGHWRQLHGIVQSNSGRMNAVHVTAVLTALARMPMPAAPRPQSSVPGSSEVRDLCAAREADLVAREAADASNFQALVAHLESAFGRHLEAAWAELSDGIQLVGMDRDTRTCQSGSESGSGGTPAVAGTSAHATAAARAVAPSMFLSAKRLSLAVGGATPHTARVAADQGQSFGTGASPAGGASLGPRQLATCLSAMARLSTAGWRVAKEPRLEQLALAAAAAWGLEAFPTQELVTLLFATAKLGLRPSAAWLKAATAAAGAAAAGGRMSPRQLSTALWALATLRHRPGRQFMAAWLFASRRAMPSFSAYDLSQSLWALATLRAVAAAAAGAPTPPGGGLPEAWVAAVLARAVVVLRPGGCAPQDVCNALWGVARLGLAPPQGWVPAVAAPLLATAAAPAAAGALERCKPVDVASLMWALAALAPHSERPTEAAMMRLCEAAARAAGRFGEQDLGNAFWALGKLRFRPRLEMLRPLGERLVVLAAEGSAGPQLITTALWCCIRLQRPPGSRLLNLLLSSAAARASSFGPHSAALLLYCLARMQHLGWLPPADWTAAAAVPPAAPPSASPAAAGPAASAEPAQRRGSGNGASESESSMRRRRRAAPLPPAPLPLRPILESALRGLAGEEFEAEAEGPVARQRVALPVLLWSLWRLGCTPEKGWLRSVLVHSVELLPSLSPAEASLVTTCLVKLRYVPPPLWLGCMEQLWLHRWEPMAAEEDRALAAAVTAAAVAESMMAAAEEAAGTAPAEGTVTSATQMPQLCVRQGRPVCLEEMREELERRKREVAWRQSRVGYLATALGRLRLGMGLLRRQSQRLRNTRKALGDDAC